METMMINLDLVVASLVIFLLVVGIVFSMAWVEARREESENAFRAAQCRNKSKEAGSRQVIGDDWAINETPRDAR